VNYSPHDFRVFRVTPLNQYAHRFLFFDRTEMSEKEWVRFLYRIRGYEVPEEVLEGLSIEV
jgi:hypothetical protein